MRKKVMRHNEWMTLLVIVFSAGVGCGGASAYTTIPVEDARALHSHVGAFYNTTQSVLEDSSQAVSVVAEIPADIRPRDFELQLVKTALMGCFNDPIAIIEMTNEPPRETRAIVGEDEYEPLSNRATLGNVSHCHPAELIALESYLGHAPEHIRAFIIERTLSVDTLRVNLKHVLQERLNLLEEHSLDSESEVARLRDASVQRFEQVMSNPGDYDAQQQQQTRADYEVIQGELADIESLLETIAADLPEMRSYRRQLVEDIAVALAGMGTPDS